MSTTTMSAPCSASARACALPCPRPPPVMIATCPSSFPISRSVSAGVRARYLIDLPASTGQLDACDVASLVAREKQHRVADVDQFRPKLIGKLSDVLGAVGVAADTRVRYAGLRASRHITSTGGPPSGAWNSSNCSNPSRP